MENLKKIFEFLHLAGRLKEVERYNQKKNGQKESVADHCWRLSLMAFLLAEEIGLNINLFRAVKIAIVHDITESLTGDIDAILVMEGKVSKEEKRGLEESAIEEIKNILPSEAGEEICGLWTEYEACQTEEAKFIKALDKLETLTHLCESGHNTYDKPELIPNYADEAVKNFPNLSPALQEIKSELKEEFKKGGVEWKEAYDKI